MRRADMSADDCAIAQALDVVGDWWTLLIVRDIARGRCRFGELQAGLGASRKVVSQRLRMLVAQGIVRRDRYLDHPPRYEYRLGRAGTALLPVLVALQDWGATWVLGDGALSATTTTTSAEASRVRDLAGTSVPPLRLPRAGGGTADPVADTAWTIMYCYPGTAVPGAVHHPPGWDEIPGAAGCGLEARTYRDHVRLFADRHATVTGVSTQRPDEQTAFAAASQIPFPLLSDSELRLTAALRLPTFRAAGVDRLKRLTLIIDQDRVVRSVIYPIADITGSVVDAIKFIERVSPR